MRALVIDADPHAAYAISLMLKEHAINSDQVGSARQGLELAQHNSYDIILMDLDLSDMSARQWLRRVRGSDLVRPILLLARCDQPEGRSLALQAGADGCLAKPFGGAELYSRIRTLLPIPEAQPQRSGGAGGAHGDVAARQAVLPHEEANPEISTASGVRHVAAPPSLVAA